jgi:hypothetical protein
MISIHLFIINHDKNQASSAGISPEESGFFRVFFRTAHSRAKPIEMPAEKANNNPNETNETSRLKFKHFTIV